MSLQLYLLDFDQAHFSQGLLAESLPSFTAARLFSALFLEAMKMGKAEDFIQLAGQEEFHLSNGLLYRYGLYLPKPIGYPAKDSISHSEKDSSRRQAKIAKSLDYVFEYDFDDYVHGEIADLSVLKEETQEMYEIVTQTKVSVLPKYLQDQEQGDPYQVGQIFYHPETRIAVIGSDQDLLVSLFQSLQYSGLGGLRSRGMGRFSLTIEALEEELSQRITSNTDKAVMLLNDSLPNDEELDQSLQGAQYLLNRASGFAYSLSENNLDRKADLYEFAAGSTFQGTFTGDIYNVAPQHYSHPVWHYSKPLFYLIGDSYE